MSGIKEISRYFSGKRILIPVIIGISIAFFLLWKDFSLEALRTISWSKNAWIWVLASIGMMMLRDLGYIIRLRILSSGKLSFRQSFEIAFLWEFASAISPGAIGGTAVALLIMAQEKLKTGLTTTIVLLTSFLDELFYIIMVPLVFIFLGSELLFPELGITNQDSILNIKNLKIFFWTGYSILFLWTIFLAWIILVNPNYARRMIIWFSSFPILKKKRSKIEQLAEDVYVASFEFRKNRLSFWLKAFGATFLSWTARFLMLNCLLMAFSGFDEHILVYGRQLIMWVILLVAITPGGSGIAEGIFPVFIKEFVPSVQIAKVVAIVWRLLSYYPYLFIGLVVLPIWVKRIQKISNSHETSEFGG